MAIYTLQSKVLPIRFPCVRTGQALPTYSHTVQVVQLQVSDLRVVGVRTPLGCPLVAVLHTVLNLGGGRKHR